MNKKLLSLVLIFLVLIALPVFASGNKEKADEEQSEVVEVVDTVVESASTVETVAEATAEKTLAKIELGTLSEEITSTDVDSLLATYKEAGIEITEAEALEYLVNQVLINLTLESQNYELTDEIATNLVVYYIQNTLGVAIESQEQLDEIISKYQIDVNTLLASLARSYFLSVYLSENYSDILNQDATPTEEEISSVYVGNKNLFKNSQKVKIAHIYFDLTEDKSEEDVKAAADAVYASIKNSSLTFEQAVTDYSEDGDTKANAGILGWVNSSETDFEKEIAALTGNLNIAASAYHKQLFTEDTYNAIIALKAGEISPVLKSSSGYHIFKALVRNEEKLLGLNDHVYPEVSLTVKQYLTYALESELVSAYENQAVAQLVTDARSSAVVTYY
ncbi:MAG: peptidylprolyl isomerase [Sphaerochaetaceae bacterium]|nr:peptidylprolyl isomerase [Sphaerochaetaceae bacterium]